MDTIANKCKVIKNVGNSQTKSEVQLAMLFATVVASQPFIHVVGKKGP